MNAMKQITIGKTAPNFKLICRTDCRRFSLKIQARMPIAAWNNIILYFSFPVREASVVLEGIASPRRCANHQPGGCPDARIQIADYVMEWVCQFRSAAAQGGTAALS